MPLLFPFAWTSQPQQFIAPSGPFARGLVFAAIPGDRSIAVTPAQPVVSGSSTVVVGRGGRGARAPATQIAGYVGYSSDLSIAANQDYTLAAFCIPSSGSTTGSTPTQDFIGAQTNFLSIASNGFRAQLDNNTTALNAYTRMDPALFMATRRGSTLSAYVPSGAVVTAATGTRAQTFTTICAGRYSGNNHTDTETYLLLVWNRGIGLDEYLALSKNVWQIFAQKPQRLWIPSETPLSASYGDTATPADDSTAALIAASAISESATTADNATAAIVTAAAWADSATPADSIAAALVTAAAYADDASTVDAYSAALVAGGTSDYTDTATPLDAITAALVTSTAWADAAVPVDSIAAALVAQSAYADSAAPADSYDATLVSGGTSSYADQATPVDAYTAVFIARADYADACTAQDLYAGALAGEADPALRQSIYLRLADQAPFVRLSDQSPIVKL